MKKLILPFALCFTLTTQAQVGVGTTTADASAALDVVSTTKGFLPPRMTQAQRTAVGSPATGLMVYQTDGTAGLYYYSGSAWIYIINGSTATLPLASGGTGATTAASARTALGAAASGANTDIISLAPTSAGAINNMAIGGTTPAAGTFTTLNATGVITANAGTANSFTLPAARGTNGEVLTTNGSGAANWAAPASQVPAGTIVAFAGTTAPAGWAFCNGAAVSRTTNAALFTAISTTYGVGDGSSTFNLPDLRGRTVFGKDDMGGTTAQNRITSSGGGITGTTLGATGGAQSRALGTSELPAHTHAAGSLSTSTNGSHSHHFDDAFFAENYNGGSNNWVGNSGSTDLDNSFFTRATWTQAAGDHSHTVNGTTASTGSGSAFSLLNPGIVLNYIIKL